MRLFRLSSIVNPHSFEGKTGNVRNLLTCMYINLCRSLSYTHTHTNTSWWRLQEMRAGNPLKSAEGLMLLSLCSCEVGEISTQLMLDTHTSLSTMSKSSQNNKGILMQIQASDF